MSFRQEFVYPDIVLVEFCSESPKLSTNEALDDLGAAKSRGEQ